MKTYQDGDEVIVRDPDGQVWKGHVVGESVLWKDWYLVRGSLVRGKAGPKTVHANDLTRRDLK